MILQRYHGPPGDLMSSKHSQSSVPFGAQSDSYDDRGFLNMAISHLQNNPNGGSNTGKLTDLPSNVVTNAELNQSLSIEKNVNTDASETTQR